MTEREKAMNRAGRLYFGSQEKADEFFKVLYSVSCLPNNEIIQALNKFNKQWQKELKQVAGSREHQTG